MIGRSGFATERELASVRRCLARLAWELAAGEERELPPVLDAPAAKPAVKPASMPRKRSAK